MNTISKIKANLKELEQKGHSVKVDEYQPIATIINKNSGAVFIVDFQTKGVRYPVKIMNAKGGRASAEFELVSFLRK